MSNAKLLQGKRAVVFGAGGSIGSAVAIEMAAEGAKVYLAGRTRTKLEEVAREIGSRGGAARVDLVDATDGEAVDRYIDALESSQDGIDIEFNAVGPLASDYGNGKRAIELSAEEFMVPLTTIVKSQFITARSVARHMAKRRSGVIFFLTGSPARGHVEGATAIGAAFGAVEALMENLAVELGTVGVRTVCLRTTANTDSRTIQQTVEALAARMNIPKDQMIAHLANLNFLKVPATVRDTARAAALLASDRLRMMTGTVVNCTAGAALD